MLFKGSAEHTTKRMDSLLCLMQIKNKTEHGIK